MAALIVFGRLYVVSLSVLRVWDASGAAQYVLGSSFELKPKKISTVSYGGAITLKPSIIMRAINHAGAIIHNR